MNKYIAIGNMTRDPELRYTPAGTAVCNFGVAMNRSWLTESGEKKEEVTFVDFTAFGRQAEAISQYCRKGKQVAIESRLKTESWDDKTTGQKRHRLVAIVESIQFLGSKDGAGNAPQGE